MAVSITLASAASARAAIQLQNDTQADSLQRVEGAWNAPRVRELVGRAIVRRATWAGEEVLQDYRAHARGHIYFLYDLGRGTERHLVKADQMALDLYWRAPGRTRQLIVGRRERKVLPTNIRYHLDHLTVVMDNLGDRVSLGEGSEVRDALHPAAPQALEFYEYRLTDSLTLVMPDREVRVYKVDVRPQDPNGAGLVGAIYLDRLSADIVQMEFTFTAASYLDDTLDYFSIRLENALWEGRYWLPHRQGIELRRDIKALKFPAGGIIRAEFRISDYQFNTGTPESFFRGPQVTALAASVREAFEFDEGLYAALDPDVAVAPPSLEEIRESATQIVTESYLQRLEGLRLAVPGVSSVLRFRRSEGLYVGPGLSRGFPGSARGILLAGYAFGADRWGLEGRLQVPLVGSLDLELEGYWNLAADVTPWAASSGAIATLAALLDGEDYRAPFWASGAGLALVRPWGAARARVSLAWESWEPATLGADDLIDRSYRGVRAVDDGEVAWLAVELKRPPLVAVEAVGGLSWEGRLEAVSRLLVGDFEYVRVTLRAEQFWPAVALGLDLRLSAAAGAVGGGRIPAQRLFPAGGRGSVRGYGFHRYAGNLYGSGGIELSRKIRHPWVSLSLFADVGGVGSQGSSAERALDVWNRAGDAARATHGPLIGVGAGVGLVFDILRVELARGLRQGGIWELVVRVRPDFWDWL
ncbi:MAG: BamA/TamA family outer membrane protein [Gemmatimonadota bacterium]|nr:MAG: BamA/TamA family outer membrane protein [Gemmatimonadota bacterium]